MKKVLLFFLCGFLFLASGFAQVYPTITSFSPTTAGPDDTVTIIGSNFVDTVGHRFLSVKIGGTIVTTPSISPTIIKAIIGVGISSGNVAVSYDNFSTSGDSLNASLPGYTWNGYPVIYSVSPILAHAGDTVTIIGKYLAPGGVGPIAPTVTFGGVAAAKVIAISYDEVKAIVGNGSSGSITLASCCFGSTIYNGFSFLPTINLLAQDSLVVVDLYNSTNGSSWIHHANWLTAAPLSSWYGVNLQSGRIQSLTLPNNNLVGTLPSSLGSLAGLTYLDLSYNKLSGSVPSSFSQLSTSYSNVINLENNQLSGDLSPLIGAFAIEYGTDTALYNNHFTFTSFENVMTTLESLVGIHVGYGISPQANIPLNNNNDLLTVSAGGTLSNNTYKWYNGNALVATKTGDSTYTAIASGKYSVAVTNTVVTQLTLYSDSVNIIIPTLPPASVQDSLALVNLYDSANGSSWANHTNWLTTAPLSAWYGVTVNGSGRVTGLALGNNNLVGRIPFSIVNLSQITNILDLENNQLSDTIPTMPPADSILIRGNDYNFTELEAARIASPIGSLNLEAYPEQTLPLHQQNNSFSVSAGGTLSNNTYQWYNGNRLVATKIGDSTFVATTSGRYSVVITNAVFTQTSLNSDSLDISILLPIEEDSSISSCHSIIFDGISYASSAVVLDTVKSVVYINIDSIYHVTTITVNPILPVTQDSAISSNNSVVFNGVTYTEPAFISDTLKSQGGCDSVYRSITITVGDSINPPNKELAYPNPAHGTTSIIFVTPTAGAYSIEIRDLSGATVASINGASVAGTNIIPLYVRGFAPGIYILTLIDSTGKHHSKLEIE
ncbi:MAG TPA: T9SS type A sorting domain-containing protein [Ferruginibacter sp.]|jgi:hypothetical protein|nr:T9SS type A sorting domain-containing protein [Ferruginibacter sp.]